MAHFMGTVQGNRGEASRLGSKGGGMVARVNGWNSGVKVVAEYNAETDTDVFHIFGTRGSGNNNEAGYIGQIMGSTFISAEKA